VLIIHPGVPLSPYFTASVRQLSRNVYFTTDPIVGFVSYTSMGQALKARFNLALIMLCIKHGSGSTMILLPAGLWWVPAKGTIDDR
jgi:hypothetical protein